MDLLNFGQKQEHETYLKSANVSRYLQTIINK